MKSEHWENKAQPDYYETQPGTDATETGETQAGEDGLYPPNTSPNVFYLGNIWCAAACIAYGVTLLGYGRSPRSGYMEWALDNSDGVTARLAREFKVPDELVIPIHRIQKAYRTACQVRAVATRGLRYDRHGQQNRKSA